MSTITSTDVTTLKGEQFALFCRLTGEREQFAFEAGRDWNDDDTRAVEAEFAAIVEALASIDAQINALLLEEARASRGAGARERNAIAIASIQSERDDLWFQRITAFNRGC